MTRRPGGWWLGVALLALVQSVLVFALYEQVVGYPALRRLDDLDAPWHLACGRVIVETGAVPREDPICFTTAGVEWININWLAQVVLYRLYLVAGWQGPIVLAALLCALALAATADRFRLREAPAWATVLLLPAAAWVLDLIHTVRPQAATFAGVAACAWLLDLPDPERRLGPRRALAVAALLAVWMQLHGGFAFAVALLGLDLVGSAIDARRETGKDWLPPRSRWLAGAIVLGLLAGCAVHPSGLRLLPHVATYTRQLGPIWMATVGELVPLDLRSPVGRLLLPLLGVLIGCAAVLVRTRATRALAARDLLPLLVFGLLAVQIQRAAIPLVLLAVPALGGLVGRALVALRGQAPAPEKAPLGWLRATVTTFPAFLLGAALLWAPVSLALARPGAPGALGPPLDPGLYPLEAAAVLRRDHPRGRIFNTFNAGGLLAWAIGAERRLTLDGRGDLHHASGVDAAYVRVMGLGTGWEAQLDAWQVEVALVQTNMPIAAGLTIAGWRRTYDDGAWVILVRPPR